MDAERNAMMRRLPLLLACCCLAGDAFAQWLEPPGRGWVQLAFYHHDTRSAFDADGRRTDFFADGHAVTTSVFLTTAAGLVRGVDAWLQLPVHRLTFDNAAGDRTRTGLGDTRLFARVGPALAGLRPVPVALRAGVKLPGGDFPVDAEVIPLGEGQRDWELMLEAGHSFYPLPLYVMGWAGYRWRETNADIDWKPGDERFAFAAAGGTVGRLHWKLVAEGWAGLPPRIQQIRVESARREMLQLLPSLGIGLGPGVLEVGGRVPLAGRNFPAGPAFIVGYFARWGL